MDYLKLSVYGIGLDPELLSQVLSAQSGSRRRKGEVIDLKSLGRVVGEQDGWFFQEPIQGGAENLEQALQSFMDRHFSQEEPVRELAGRCDLCLTAGLYPDDALLDFTLEPQMLARLGALGITFNLSALYSGANPEDEFDTDEEDTL